MNDNDCKCSCEYGIGTFLLLGAIFLFSNFTHKNQNQLDDTNAYLRQVITKVDKLVEQIDKTPYYEKYQEEIKQKAEASSFLIDKMFDQLWLIKSGKVSHGYIGSKLPNFLLDESSLSFDKNNNDIHEYFSETCNYTKKQLDKLKTGLPKRSDSLDMIKFSCLSVIQFNLFDIFDKKVADKIIEENNWDTPKNLPQLLWKRIDMIKKNVQAKHKQSYSTVIMNAIKSGKIAGSHDLEEFIETEIIDGSSFNISSKS